MATMGASDVKDTLKQVLAKARLAHIRVRHRRRVLCDNGPCYLSNEMRAYLAEHQIEHTRGAPLHPMTQGGIGRYHCSIKNEVLL